MLPFVKRECGLLPGFWCAQGCMMRYLTGIFHNGSEDRPVQMFILASRQILYPLPYTAFNLNVRCHADRRDEFDPLPINAETNGTSEVRAVPNGPPFPLKRRHHENQWKNFSRSASWFD